MIEVKEHNPAEDAAMRLFGSYRGSPWVMDVRTLGVGRIRARGAVGAGEPAVARA